MTGTTDHDRVVLVDDHDVATGTADKLDAHQRGLKHRAISALVRNSAGAFLLQQRNPAKYHSGGLWTNACCSHPLPGESAADAAHRRLRQEMGIDCALTPMFVFHYRDEVPGGLIENELVHVFAGVSEGPVAPDPAEVSDWRWIRFPELEASLRAEPDAYTVWFRRYVAAHGPAIARWLGADDDGRP